MPGIKIIVTMNTNRPPQEIMDMLIDGHIDRAGELKLITIEDSERILLAHRGAYDSVS